MAAHLSADDGASGVSRSIIEELRVRDGKLFQYEAPIALLDILKKLVAQSIGGAYVEFLVKAAAPEAYAATLDRLHAWHPETAAGELKVAKEEHPSLSTLLQASCVRYAKELYRRCNFDNVSMSRPAVEKLLRGFFSRLTDPLSHAGIRDGSFFRLDAVKADYILRGVLRETLAHDCIELYDRVTKRAIFADDCAPRASSSSSPTPAADPTGPLTFRGDTVLDVGAVATRVQAAMASTAAPVAVVAAGGASAGAGADEEGDGVPEGDVFPSDSISSVIDRVAAGGGGGGGAEDGHADRLRLDLHVPAPTKDRREDDLRSIHSRTTKGTKMLHGPSGGGGAAAGYSGGAAVGYGGGAVGGGGGGGAAVDDSDKVSVASSSARSAVSRASQQGRPRVLAPTPDPTAHEEVADHVPKPRRKVILTNEPDSPPRRRRHSDDESVASHTTASSLTTHSTHTTSTTATQSRMSSSVMS